MSKKFDDGDLMDEIASYGLDLGDAEIQECLAFANEMFETGRLTPSSRKRANEILSDLKESRKD
jgi:hypothetical protein